MERRGFLRIVGLGGVAVVVSPQLLIPRPSIAVADPQTRIFLPPDIGWPVWRSQETVTDFLRRFEADRRRRDLELRALEVERLMEARRREMELRRLEFIRQQEAQPFNATGPAEDTWKIEVFQDLAAPINVQPGQTLRLWTGRRRRFGLGSRDPEVRRGAREKMTATFDAWRALSDQSPKPGPMPASVQGDLVSPVMPVDVAVVSVKYGADCERALFDEPPMLDEWQPDPRRVQITAVALYAGRPFAFVSSSHPDEQLTLENVDGMQLSRWGLRRRSPGPASVCSTA